MVLVLRDQQTVLILRDQHAVLALRARVLGEAALGHHDHAVRALPPDRDLDQKRRRPGRLPFLVRVGQKSLHVLGCPGSISVALLLQPSARLGTISVLRRR